MKEQGEVDLHLCWVSNHHPSRQTSTSVKKSPSREPETMTPRRRNLTMLRLEHATKRCDKHKEHIRTASELSPPFSRFLHRSGVLHLRRSAGTTGREHPRDQVGATLERFKTWKGGGGRGDTGERRGHVYDLYSTYINNNSWRWCMISQPKQSKFTHISLHKSPSTERLVTLSFISPNSRELTQSKDTTLPSLHLWVS